MGRPFKVKSRSSTKGNKWHMVGKKETQQTQSIVKKKKARNEVRETHKHIVKNILLKLGSKKMN